MNRRTFPLVVVTVALSLVATACGGASYGSDTTAPALLPGGDDAPEWSLVEVGTLEGAVDVVERSPDDPFLFVVSRRGIVERWSRDGTERTVVLDVSGFTTVQSERGLLGLAFRRDGDSWQGFLYRTAKNGDITISRLAVDEAGVFSPDDDPGEEFLVIEHPRGNHNGGDLEIGPDGMLYIATGDGGGANDPDRAAADLSSLLGKILRIDPDDDGYLVPDDNPHVDTPGARPEIWSSGLRNPWRIAFSDEGDLWIADVGQGRLEEINRAPADGRTPGGRGTDFGWSAWEGSERFNDDVPAGEPLFPVHEYPHDLGRCSIIGGALGNERATPGRAGWFFFSDYCSGRVEALLVDGRGNVIETVAENLVSPVAVRSTTDALWVITQDGTVRRIVAG